MVSLTLTSSSIFSSSKNNVTHVPPSPSASPAPSSTSSLSSGRLSRADDEDITVTFKRASVVVVSRGKEEGSTEDLRLLAVSTHMTELSYAISDIQTRIFEIQELRHKSQSSGDASNATSVIDQSLGNLDKRVDSVEQGIKTIADSLQPLSSRAELTPTAENSDPEEHAVLRKHQTLVSDWEAVKKEIQILREELKEDKWLTVFRTVTDQADGMMSSLEKAVNRCQEFMWQVQRRGWDDAISPSNSSSSVHSDKSPLTYEAFTGILESYEAKKKHYTPATTKVLSIIDKGVQDRVTKNGECLRRHAECSQRWHNLKERIVRTDTDMESLRRLFLQGSDSALSSGESSQSALTSVSKNGFLATPPSGEKKGRTPSHTNTISRSISPFRKFARKLKAAGSGTKSPSPGTVTPVPSKTPALSRMSSSEPTRTLRHRSSMFSFFKGPPPTPTTPERPVHKYSNSLTPETSPSKIAHGTVKRPAWNSSTRVVADERTATVKQSSRRPSISGRTSRLSEDRTIPPVPSIPQNIRSVSRASMSSSRPWSPVTSSASTAYSSGMPFSLGSTPSTAKTPVSPPRTRPKTPSHIPSPKHARSTSGELSPTSSVFGVIASPYARPSSRSMIPIPSVHVSSVSRPGTAMSRPDSAMSYRPSAIRAQTPRPLQPPSSYNPGGPRTPGSRPSSRAGAETPDGFLGEPMHIYTPVSTKDPLEMEFAAIVNSIPHSYLIERVDAPLRTTPKEGEEVRGQYTFENQLGKKTVSCKLTTMTRSGKGTTKNVMCRVGGGWTDLRAWIMKSVL